MNYREALEAIHNRSDYDRGFITNPFAGDDAAALGLRRTRALLDMMGKPDRTFPIIHVAGTKGKGSTCAFIESIARSSGKTTGLYVTPHLHTFRERIQINGRPISEETFAKTAERTFAIIDEIAQEAGFPTAFEIVTAMAFAAFAAAEVDIAIVEVGLGGRLDATNVVTPDVTVITSISYDHQRILGDTLAEIASEKAGILKPGIPVVVPSQDPEAERVIAAAARALNAPQYRRGSEWDTEYAVGLATFSGPWGEISKVTLGLPGAHQAMNAGTALMSAWLWNPDAFDDLATVRQALENTSWPGRFEVVDCDIPIIIDGAHNVASIETLFATHDDLYPGRECTLILGTSSDKDAAAMLRTAMGRVARVIVTSSHNPRAADPDELLEIARTMGLHALKSETVAEAINLASEETGNDSTIAVTGSLYIAAEAREALGLAETPAVERTVFGS